jgi:hypothetical protein
MKVAFLIVALGLALAPGAPAQPAPLASPAVTAAPMGQPVGDTTDTAAESVAPGLSHYLMLALGLFGMGLVSRRRQPD